MLNEGDTIPAVTVTRADDTPLALTELPLPAVVYFYPRDDTPGCTREVQEFSALCDQFAASDISVLGISKDTPAAHAKFAAKRSLSVMLGSDTNGSACAAFGVWGEKSLYGKTYMGIERATFLFAADGSLAKVWRRVRVAGHAAAVLAAARTL